LKPLIGTATIVGLGEATHGTHEFFTMDQRMLEFLVKQMGFTTLAFENGNWDPTRPVDSYVLTGKGNARQLLFQAFNFSLQTKEILNVIAWIRAYNAHASPSRQVHVAGLDPRVLTPAAFDEVVNYVQAVDPAQTALIRRRYAGIRPATEVAVDENGGFSTMPQAIKQRDQDNAQSVYNLLRTHQALYEARSSRHAFARALQSARAIVQYTTLGVLISTTGTYFTSAQAQAQRDVFMAQNVAWLHDQAASPTKIVVWAHNLHIANDAGNMGSLLRKWYKQDYLAIGTSFYQGTFTAFPPQSHPITFTVAAPETNTYNYTFGRIGLARYLLDIRQTPAGAVTNWVRGQDLPGLGHGLLNFGGDGGNIERYGSLQQWFDAIIHLQRITPTHPLA
jgi:erythromycin esterase